MTIELLEHGQKPAVTTVLARTDFARTADDVLGRIGNLETRLARSREEIEACLSVRYRVFVEEMKAEVAPECHLRRQETDAFDAICDHLLVIDNGIDGDMEDRVVGTYRLLRQEVAAAKGGFYSRSEFEIDQLLARHGDKRFMELGRSCVLPAYRTRRTVELLWQGNWAYALRHGIDAMFGCGSFPGIVPEEHALALSFLHHNARVRDEWVVSARPELYRLMDLMPAEAINPRTALSALPPLIKGYLRLGAMIGDGAVVDAAFNTTDVLVVLPISSIAGRYLNYYGADAGRFA
ncbi:ornithine-acyl[acyl carrier protein] N-acyltransferase [Rhizobium sp. RU20A]|uniref:GNAT family N-acetyltransferase n=1 Tax=Rhizobium sp. RU20A TaxID=1907412 RepID=UPI000957213F|nr:GNAT family N-acetyltransferase [Rhizobium sp. RU20A]SIQ70815.1 ornithine-acyl[acyl carrier protein] N-acyltransferase [Rhizobium sp. RU20A]